MIVKVQISLSHTKDFTQMLVYNEDKSILYEGDLTRRVEKLMGDSVKRFFYAKLKGTEVVLDRKAPWQEW